MFRLCGVIAVMMMLTVFSCRRTEPPVPAPILPVSAEVEIKGTFSSPVVAFIYPENALIESMKKEMGIDRFYAISDSRGAEFSKARLLAEKHQLNTWSGTTGKYRFITNDGAIVDIDLNQIKEPWKVIVFNGKDAPAMVDPIEAVNLVAQVFNLRQEQKRNDRTIAAIPFVPAGTSGIQRHETGHVVDSMPGLKQTTLRLIIFPGQTPPPLRDESSGIRIVNSYISPDHRFWLVFDNDMFSNTDRYYTNGVVIGYTAPGLTSWQINRLMIKHNRNSVVHSAISLHHGMFTPLTTKEPPPLVNDRPYASTLYLRYSQASEDALAGIRFTSALEAGVIGEAALGQLLQRSVHSGFPSNDEPMGWETQIKNDLVLGYYINIQKQLLKSQNSEIYAEGSAIAGTLHTRASMGVNAVIGAFRTGLTPLPQEYNQLVAKTGRFQYGARGGLEFRIIGYDASLQGGMFNKNNIYALKPDEIERLVAAIHLRLFAKYHKLGISISQFYLSPEFKEGRQHFWGQIGLEYGL